jgi:hypothetical protein
MFCYYLIGELAVGMVGYGLVLIVISILFMVTTVLAWQGKITRAIRRGVRDTSSPAVVVAANRAAAPLCAAGACVLLTAGIVAAVGSAGVAAAAILSGIGIFMVLLFVSAVPARRAARIVKDAERS